MSEAVRLAVGRVMVGVAAWKEIRGGLGEYATPDELAESLGATVYTVEQICLGCHVPIVRFGRKPTQGSRIRLVNVEKFCYAVMEVLECNKQQSG